jgi:hypothetical protein
MVRSRQSFVRLLDQTVGSELVLFLKPGTNGKLERIRIVM